MDPLTAALNLANSALVLATKVWDATPVAQQQAAASQWATFTHNIGGFLTAVQGQLTVTVTATK